MRMFKAQHAIITPVVGYNFKTALTVHNFHSQGSIPCRAARVYSGLVFNGLITFPLVHESQTYLFVSIKWESLMYNLVNLPQFQYIIHDRIWYGRCFHSGWTLMTSPSVLPTSSPWRCSTTTEPSHVTVTSRAAWDCHASPTGASAPAKGASVAANVTPVCQSISPSGVQDVLVSIHLFILFKCYVV